MILAVAIAGLVGGLVVSLIRPPSYTAALTMYVSAQIGDNSTAAYQGSLLSQQRVTSYVELAKGPRVLSEVRQRLNLGVSEQTLSRQVSVNATVDSVLLNVEVTTSDAAESADIANAIGSIFPPLVAELERPANPTLPPTVIVRVVEPASVPVTPSGAGIGLFLSAGLLAGILLGLLCAYLRARLDKSIREPERLREVSGSSVLALIPEDGDSQSIVTPQGFAGTRSNEAVRQLRTNLQFADLDSRRKVFLITSSVEGEGKTTTCLGLAAALGALQLRVLVIEGDLRRPSASTTMGLSSDVGVTTILTKRIDFDHAVQRCGQFSLLSAGERPPNPAEVLASSQMKSLIDAARARYDFVLVDSPPLLPVADASSLSAAVDGALVMCRYGSTTEDELRSGIATLRGVGCHVLGLVLTRIPQGSRRVYSSYYYDSLKEDVAGRRGSALMSSSEVLEDRTDQTPTPFRRP